MHRCRAACQYASQLLQRGCPVALLPRAGQKFVQCRKDLLTFVARRLHKIANLVDRDGDYLERMCSSENDPILELKSFHTATAACSVFALAKRCFCSCATLRGKGLLAHRSDGGSSEQGHDHSVWPAPASFQSGINRRP